MDELLSLLRSPVNEKKYASLHLPVHACMHAGAAESICIQTRANCFTLHD
jgi:hypothetical protein